MQSFIESGSFPVEVVNIASAKEKGLGRPPFWEMVFWWTRKRLASARAVILASLLPRDFDVERTCMRSIRGVAKVSFREGARHPQLH